MAGVAPPLSRDQGQALPAPRTEPPADDSDDLSSRSMPPTPSPVVRSRERRQRWRDRHERSSSAPPEDDEGPDGMASNAAAGGPSKRARTGEPASTTAANSSWGPDAPNPWFASCTHLRDTQRRRYQGEVQRILAGDPTYHFFEGLFDVIDVGDDSGSPAQNGAGNLDPGSSQVPDGAARVEGS